MYLNLNSISLWWLVFGDLQTNTLGGRKLKDLEYLQLETLESFLFLSFIAQHLALTKRWFFLV